jgi:ankyrin repeat protein
MAAAEGHFECLKILLELKADVFAQDIRSHTPYDLAVLWSHRNCAKYLKLI